MTEEDKKDNIGLGSSLIADETSPLFDDEGICDFMLVADPEYLDERS